MEVSAEICGSSFVFWPNLPRVLVYIGSVSNTDIEEGDRLLIKTLVRVCVRSVFLRLN